MLTEGTYKATILEYSVLEPKPGKSPQVAVKFQINNESELTDDKETIVYYGSLSPKALPYTLANLLRCGLKSDDLSTLCESDAFDGREIELVLENDTYEGKTRLKVQWINEIGGSKFKAIAKDQAKSMLSHLSGDVAAARHEMGIKTKPKEKVADFDLAAGDDGVPF